MKTKLSSLKLQIILLLFVWSVTGVYCILKDFEIKGHLSFVVLAVSSVLSAISLYKIYNPVSNPIKLYGNFILCGDKYIFENEIIRAFEVNSLEKIIFALKCPRLDYSTSFFKKGLILKTLYDSYLIDDLNVSFIESKKLRKTAANNFSFIIMCLAWLIPLAIFILNPFFNIDILSYAAVAMALLVVIILRIFPPFYLSKKLEHNTLPLSPAELKEFHGITIIEGFALSDKLAVVPFTKPVYLDGLAFEVLFRRYIVINPRVFTLGSEDYLRFVLFHELSHIKHHDSLGIFLVVTVTLLIDLVISLLPLEISSIIYKTIPYYEYMLSGLVFLYAFTVILKRKKVERRADIYGIQAVGKEGASRIYENTGIDLRKLI